MIIKRNNLEALSYTDISNARMLYLCPICSELSDILNGDAILREVICNCGGVMELLLTEIPEKEGLNDEDL